MFRKKFALQLAIWRFGPKSRRNALVHIRRLSNHSMATLDIRAISEGFRKGQISRLV